MPISPRWLASTADSAAAENDSLAVEQLLARCRALTVDAPISRALLTKCAQRCSEVFQRLAPHAVTGGLISWHHGIMGELLTIQQHVCPGVDLGIADPSTHSVVR